MWTGYRIQDTGYRANDERRTTTDDRRAATGTGGLGFAALGLFLLACTPLGTKTLGPLREVTVVSDHWDLVDSTVVMILQQPVPTPQPEPEFKVRVGSSDKFDTYSRFRIVFLVGVSQDSLMRQVLGARADSLSQGDYGLFLVPNPWTKDQFALIFVARDASGLVPGLVAYGARIRTTLREVVLNQLARAAYIEGVDKAGTEELSRRYSFSIDVPRRWLVNEDHGNSRFVYMYGHFPDRNVFVYWEDTTRQLVPYLMAAVRDSLAGMFYDGDSIDPEFLRVDTISFLAGPCLRLSGVWRNERETIGGPFVNYSFNFQGRFYMLDGLVFDPGKKKLDHLVQVEAVVRTFTPR